MTLALVHACCIGVLTKPVNLIPNAYTWQNLEREPGRDKAILHTDNDYR